MSDNFFSINGDRALLNFPPNTVVWLKDSYDDIYEPYMFTIDPTSEKPFRFDVTKEDSIMEISSFSFETEAEAIKTLTIHYLPKLTEDGEICNESKCAFSNDPNCYIYNMTKYSKSFLVDLSDIFVSVHKYRRDLDPSIDYLNLPPISVKYTNQDGYLYEILDGFHRTKYSKLKGYTKIPVILY